MRRITPFLELYSIDPNKLYQFPFEDLHTFAWGEKAFRIFVDANNSNPVKDGKSWDTAFTTIQDALDFLPDDLMLNNAFILVAGGNYTFPSITTKKNGILLFEYIGDKWNNINDPDFLTAGKTFTANPITIEVTSEIALSGRNVEVHFRSRTSGWQWVYGGWNIKVMPTAVLPSYVVFNISADMHVLVTNMLVDLSLTNSTAFRQIFRVLHPSSSLCGLTIDTFSVLGFGTDGVGDWDGVIAFADATEVCRVNIGTSWFGGWAAGKESPNSKKFVFNNLKKWFTLMPVSTAMIPRMNIDLTSIDFTPGITGQTKIKMSFYSSHYGGKLKIDDSLVDLADASGKIGELNKTNSGTITYYTGKGFSHNGVTPVIATNNSAPADALLNNKDISLWIDEITNKLMIKLKYSNGTIKSGEVALI